ncbi:MAG: hypothetical protein RLZZ60_90 [Bacteroidota bacterium]|jgi:hypothetical protein
MKTLLSTLFFFVCLTNNFAQTTDIKVTLSGYIKDSANGESIVGAIVKIEGTELNANSNVYGFYSLSVAAGNYTVVVSQAGFTSSRINLNITQDLTRNFELSKVEEDFKGVSIKAKKRENFVEKVDMSTNNLNITQIKKVPALLGEVDIVKSVQLLPGVSTVGEGASGFNVRGGSIDQNLILLDEAPVFNASHLFGFFSVFNPDAVKDVKLIKGGMPAQYGGRVSSTLDVRMKDGNTKKTEVNGGVGVIFSRLSIEGPIAHKNEKFKNKSSYIIAGRRSYVDVLSKPFLAKNENLKDAIFYFYDLTAKVNYVLNANNKFYLSAYSGKDAFGVPGALFNWGNQTATLRWNHLFSKKLFSNFTTYYSQYNYQLGFGEGDNTFRWKSNITNYSIKPDFTYYITPNNTLQFGLVTTYYIFKPGDAVSRDQGQVVQFGLPNKYALENAFYLENEQKVNTKMTLRYGLRWSNFNYLGSGSALMLNRPIAGQRAEILDRVEYKKHQLIQAYNVPEPRFSANYKVNKFNAFKLSYNRMSQYLHLISNTAASVPLDVWTPSTNNIKPQISDQLAIGYFKNVGKAIDYEFSAEAFYKSLQNQIDYIDGANLLLNNGLEAELLSGKGRAYGLELYAKKNSGQLTGWIAYTLSKSERQVNGISNDQWYNNRFDRRHNANITLSYEWTKKWSTAVAWVFASGTPTNLPNTKYSFQGYQGIPQNADNLRNNVTIKPYNRLDISATWVRKKTKTWESNWVFGIYNAYARRNPFSYYTQVNPDNNNQTQLIRYSIIGSVIPSVSWNFKF